MHFHRFTTESHGTWKLLYILAVLKQYTFMVRLFSERHFIPIWDSLQCHSKSIFICISAVQKKNITNHKFIIFLPASWLAYPGSRSYKSYSSDPFMQSMLPTQMRFIFHFSVCLSEKAIKGIHWHQNWLPETNTKSGKSKYVCGTWWALAFSPALWSG